MENYTFDKIWSDTIAEAGTKLDNIAKAMQSNEVTFDGIRFRKVENEWQAYDTEYGWHPIADACGHIEEAIHHLIE